MKTLIPLFILLTLAVFVHSQQASELQTKIVGVTVFTQGAQIFRSGTAELREGKSNIQLTGLSPDIDPKSIHVKVDDGITILSIAHQLNHLPSAHKNQSMDSLNTLLKQLDLQVRYLRTRFGVIDETISLLSENKDLSTASSSVSIDQLEKALVLFEKTLTDAENEKLLIALRIDSIEIVKQRINQKMLELRGTPVLSKSEINILVKADHSGSFKFDVSYVVKNAGWFSRYDIRAKDISKPIQLVYKADVFQRTGEVWENVKLKFSNGSPYARQTAPDLPTWKLNYLRNTVFRRIGAEHTYGTRMIEGTVRDENGEPLIFANVVVDGHNLGTQTDLDGNFSLLVPAGAASLNAHYTGYSDVNIPITGSNVDIKLSSGKVLDEVSVVKKDLSYSYSTAGLSRSPSQNQEVQPTVVIENQINIEFELENPATILSDGKITNLEMLSYEIPAEYVYEASPKIDRGAYLIATLTDWEKYHLSEGQANLFFNNTYIGKTIINPGMMSDTLELSLGRDPEIIIERKKIDEFSKKNFLGSTTIAERSFKISVRNNKQYPVYILLSDQIPVSVNEAITVTAINLSGGILDEDSGKVKWNIELQPGDSKDLLLNYLVKYPSRERIALE